MLPRAIISALGAVIRSVKVGLFFSRDNHWPDKVSLQLRFLSFYPFTFLLFIAKGRFFHFP